MLEIHNIIIGYINYSKWSVGRRYSCSKQLMKAFYSTLYLAISLPIISFAETCAEGKYVSTNVSRSCLDTLNPDKQGSVYYYLSNISLSRLQSYFSQSGKSTEDPIFLAVDKMLKYLNEDLNKLTAIKINNNLQKIPEEERCAFFAAPNGVPDKLINVFSSNYLLPKDETCQTIKASIVAHITYREHALNTKSSAYKDWTQNWETDYSGMMYALTSVNHIVNSGELSGFAKIDSHVAFMETSGFSIRPIPGVEFIDTGYPIDRLGTGGSAIVFDPVSGAPVGSYVKVGAIAKKSLVKLSSDYLDAEYVFISPTPAVSMLGLRTGTIIDAYTGLKSASIISRPFASTAYRGTSVVGTGAAHWEMNASKELNDFTAITSILEMDVFEILPSLLEFSEYKFTSP